MRCIMKQVTILTGILAFILLSTIAWGLTYRTIYNPFTGKLDYFTETDSTDNISVNTITATANGTFGTGIKIGTGVDGVEGAIRYTSDQLQFYNSSGWQVTGGTGGGADTTCNDVDGKCNLMLYYSNTSDGSITDINISGELNATTINVADSLSLGVGNITGLSYYTPTQIESRKYYNSSNFTIDDYYTKTNIEARKYYNASNFTIDDYYTKANIETRKYYNSSNFSIDDYYDRATIIGFNHYNSSDFSISDYYTAAQILAFDHYNSSDFSITDYYTQTQIIGFNHYNSSDFSIADYYTRAEVETLSYYNSSHFGTGLNSTSDINTAVNASTSLEFPLLNVTINLTLGSDGWIYYNGTCIIIQGPNSAGEFC